MRKNVRFVFGEWNENIRVETVIDENSAKLTIGAWEDNMGGNDGESFVMNCKEFGEFIDACSTIEAIIRSSDQED